MTTETVWNTHTIRDLERKSIKDFVAANRYFLSGRVLDFGAGKPGTCAVPQPYKHILCSSASEYLPFDKGDELPEGKFHAILCTQVIQYLIEPLKSLQLLRSKLTPGGFLVITYPTNWDEVETEDLWRYTRSGMDQLLRNAGFIVVINQRRAEIELGGFKFALGYGAIATVTGQRPNTLLTEDQSIEILTRKIVAKEPFYFTKYGDGAIECIYGLGRHGQTCDGEKYTPYLKVLLKESWDKLIDASNVYIGDWFSADFGDNHSSVYAEQYRQMIGLAKPNWLHFECLLLHRRSQALVEFYKAIKNVPVMKVLVGPAEMAHAARSLGCYKHIVTPMVGLYAHVERIEKELLNNPFDIVLYGAGMAGNIPITNVWEKFPDRTYINLGSALDPVYRGKTRKAQLSSHEIRVLMRGIL